MPHESDIKALLEAAYGDFHSHFYRERDPISLAHRYDSPRDREIAAFFAALLAYGNVTSILSSVGKILAVLGPSPYATLTRERCSLKFTGFYHRFTTGDDIEILCHWVSHALKTQGSLENFFAEGAEANVPMKLILGSFIRRFTQIPLSDPLRRTARKRERNLKYLLSDPERGSACKRLNMFLRWMIRPDDGIDLGLWKSIPPAQLMLPVDTHLLQTLQLLKWTQSKQATWKVVESATARLREYCPEDPIKYDFALCHLSMAGNTLAMYL